MAPKKNAKKKNNTSTLGDLDLDQLMAEATGQAPPQKDTTQESAPASNNQAVEDEADAFLNSLSGGSNKNKNKNKKKKNAKKEEEPAAPAAEPSGETAEVKPEGEQGEKEAGNKKKKDKKKKESKQSAMGAMIQARLEKARQEEEERKRKEEEERKRIEEEERKRKEEEERILQRKLRKKEKEREKIERQKAEGTYLTEGQKRKLKQDREKLERMKMLGLNVPEIEKKEDKKKREEERKKREEERKKKEEERKRKEEEKKKEEEQQQEEEEEDDVLDDWEDMLDDNEGEEVEQPPAESEPAAPQEPSDESDSEYDSSEPDSDMDEEELREYEIEKARRARLQRESKARENRDPNNLRCPVVVVMGHVDTGKTSLLDKIRRTNVQTGEAGGITQQIGATYLPADNLKKCTDKAKKYLPFEYKVPGLLVIDTPGHESFSNLRSRGSSLCDIAILVVDIMHGLENQTIESLNMLLEKKVPFIVALNKIDRMYGWVTHKDMSFKDTFNQQPQYTKEEFETRTKNVITEFMTRGLNAALYWENDDTKNTISLVPTSAVTGEGLSDLLGLLIKLSQDHLSKKLMFYDSVQCTILEKKVDEGLGLSLDVILINGTLHVGDTIVMTGLNGPIVTQIRALLTPEPMRDARVKGTFARHDVIKGAMGLKISATNLDEVIAGSSLYVCTPKDNLEELKETVQEDLKRFNSLLHKNDEGVFVQASTLGSLEALLEFLNKCSPPIPVSGFNIGPLHKRDVIQASIMLEKKKEYATILAFDVKITPEAQQYADDTGVKIFSADIIYHLFDRFTEYIDNIREGEKNTQKSKAVFPCALKIIPQYIFNRQNPIVVGVDVQQGILKPNTPLFVLRKEEIEVKSEVADDNMIDDSEKAPEQKKMKTIYRPLVIGTVTSIELDHKSVSDAPEGKSVAISINQNENQSNIAFGRQFDENNILYSYITRESIDALKTYFKSDMKDDYWRLVIELKKTLKIN